MYQRVVAGKAASGLTLLQEAVTQMERVLGLTTPTQRALVVVRLDWGFGGADSQRGYHLLGKMQSGRRARKLAGTVTQWRPTTRACAQSSALVYHKSMTNRGELTNEQWARLEPLLPPQKPTMGRPAKDHRQIINGIRWKLRTGAPWRDLPERYGPWSTVHSRFRRWRRAGVWDRILATLQQQADTEGRLDWQLHFVDGSVVRAHQHAAGAKGGTPNPRPWAAAGAASAPRCTSGRRVAASP